MSLATALKATTAAALLAAAQTAPAQSTSKDAACGLSGSVGVGVGVATLPTYEGSPERRSVVWQAYEASGFRLCRRS